MIKKILSAFILFVFLTSCAWAWHSGQVGLEGFEIPQNTPALPQKMDPIWPGESEFEKPGYVVIYENCDVNPCLIQSAVFYLVIDIMEFMNLSDYEILGIYLIGQELK